MPRALSDKARDVVFRLRRKQLFRLFRARLGDIPNRADLESAIALALDYRSIADFTSETLGVQVGLTWEEKDRLRLTHINCVDRTNAWLTETQRSRRREKDAARKRAQRARKAVKQRPFSMRARAVLSLLGESIVPTTAKNLALSLETHAAFAVDGELLRCGSMRTAINRALDELSNAGVVDSETKPGTRGLLERTISLKSPSCGRNPVTVTRLKHV